MKTIELLKNYYELEIHLVKVNHLDQKYYDFFSDKVDVFYESSELTKAMRECHFAFAASGTVTLSTGLFEIPTIVCYKASLLNEFVFYNFINYQGPISLTNIIHKEVLFPEFVQSEVEPVKLASVIRSWTTNEKLYNDLKSKLKETKNLLSGEDFSIPEFMERVIHE
jgi:lipid-A-disaccharide synthase